MLGLDTLADAIGRVQRACEPGKCWARPRSGAVLRRVQRSTRRRPSRAEPRAAPLLERGHVPSTRGRNPPGKASSGPYLAKGSTQLIAVVAIYGCTLVLCLVVGVLVNAALDIGGRWATMRALPLGGAATIAVLYFLAFFMPTATAVPVLGGILVAGWAIVLGLRRRHALSAGEPRSGRVATSIRRAITPGLFDVLIVAGGVIGGILLLVPLLRLGFPTTLAYSNNDGWAYVSNIEWLHSHAFGPRVVTDMERPTTFAPFAQLRDGFGVGFELLASAPMVVLRRSSFEMVNVVSAIGIPVAVVGWASLWRSVTGRVHLRDAALVGLGVVSPVFLLPYTENYTTQFVAISFMPFAMASFVDYARRPGVLRAIPAALGSAAVLGTYPPLAPWLAPSIIFGAFIGSGWPSTWKALWHPRPHLARLRRVILVVGGFAVALIALAPIPLRHTLRWFTSHSAQAGVPFPRLAGGAYVIFGSGVNVPFGYITGARLSWAVIALAGVVVPILVLGLLLPVFPSERRLRSLLPITLGVVVATGSALLAFWLTDPLGYGLYKSLIAGCSLLAGLSIVGLTSLESGAKRTPCLLAIGFLFATWLPVSSQLVQQVGDSTTGFRAPDVELGRALADLPADAIVLVEGAAEEPGSFQVRMTSSYFGADYAHLRMEGLGSTASYITPGGPPQWRPDRAWDYVVAIRESARPFRSDRRLVWTNGTYWIYKSARLDFTPFSPTWYRQERDAQGDFQWTAGDVQIVVSNRSLSARHVDLRLTATSYARTRVLTFELDGAPESTRRLFANSPTRLTLPIEVGPRSTVAVTLKSNRGPASAPAPDVRSLSLRLQDISLSGR